jgi:hypothetical protein
LVLSALERLEPFAAGKVTKLAMRTGLNLSDAFFADSKLQPDLCQSQLSDSSDPVTAREDPPLTLVEPIEPAPDHRPPLVLDLFSLDLVEVGQVGPIRIELFTELVGAPLQLNSLA